MIIKNFEVDKINLKKNKFYLFYGENQGQKNDIVNSKFKKLFLDSTYQYDENEILNNQDNFFNKILSKSFFEKEKLIIINRSTDKIKDIIEEIINKKIEDLIIILNSNILEKKSKLRSFFERSKETICIAFYEDSNQTLTAITYDFFKKNKLSVSQESINLIVERSMGDRQNLKNELSKIENFIVNKKKIGIEEIAKLTNLAENYDISELIDNCLAKNKTKTIHILNENRHSLEDCIFIIRTFLIKSKRLLKLNKELEIKKNIENAISSHKPPIFWKDKEIIKQQLKNWSCKETENLIYRINETELLIKKNSQNSINILSNFIIEEATTVNS